MQSLSLGPGFRNLHGHKQHEGFYERGCCSGQDGRIHQVSYVVLELNYTCSRMRMPILQAMGRFIRKYKEQEIRIIDTAALICTALWADGKLPQIQCHKFPNYSRKNGHRKRSNPGTQRTCTFRMD
jgi:hypothetical protein